MTTNAIHQLAIPAKANLRSKLSAQRGRSQNRRAARELRISRLFPDSGVRRNDGGELKRGAKL